VIKPRSAILDLLSPRGRRPISVAAIVEACALFGISSNNTRVALARLVADGRLDKVGPASYALSEDAEYFNRRVLGWSQIDKLDKGWNAKWTMVHLQRPPSTRTREYARRAYRFARVAEVNPTLAVRPDNLRLDHYDLRDTLITFGLFPLRGNPVLTLKSMEGWVKGTGFDLEKRVGASAESSADAITVLIAPQKSLEDKHIQGSLKELDTVFVSRCRAGHDVDTLHHAKRERKDPTIEKNQMGSGGRKAGPKPQNLREIVDSQWSLGYAKNSRRLASSLLCV